MINTPFISILVPIFNVEKYLEECLSSIVAQTLENIEIICINDGSNDKSLSIINEFMKKDKRIILINKTNSGYGDSMNQGLKEAKGEYIGIIESDDIIKLRMFETLYNLAKSNNFPDIVKSNYYQYWSQNNEIQFIKNIKKNFCNKIFKPSKNLNIFRIAPSIWSAIYKNSFLKKHEICFLPTPGASYQDTSFNFKVFFYASSMYCTQKAFVKYRQDNINSSTNNKEKIFCICDEYKEIEKLIASNLSLKPLFLSVKFDAYLWNYNRLSDQYKEIFLLKFREEFFNDKEYIKTKFFSKMKYVLLQKLLTNSILFEKELYNSRFNYLDSITKKLISKTKYYKEQNFILYGFNDIAKNLLKNGFKNISFIIDRNSLEKSFYNIPITTINNLNIYKNEIFLITATTEVFIKEIRELILQRFPNAHIISL